LRTADAPAKGTWVDTRQPLEGQRGEVVVRADAAGAVGHVLRLGLGVRDEVGQRAVRAVGEDEEGARIVDDVGDEREVLEAVARAALDRDGDDVGRVDEADRVAVGPRPGELGKADLAARARAVVHYDRLPQRRLHEPPQRARGGVGAAARREGDDHGDGPLGIGGPRLGRDQGSKGER
jgi:hypothetical protein